MGGGNGGRDARGGLDLQSAVVSADLMVQQDTNCNKLLIPDKPPVLGYCCPNNISLLSWSENRA